jgi:hypothetical protein
MIPKIFGRSPLLHEGSKPKRQEQACIFGQPATVDSLTAAIQSELVILADFDFYREKERLELSRSPCSQVDKERLLHEIELHYQRRRLPHVIRLGQLHQQLVAITLSTKQAVSTE